MNIGIDFGGVIIKAAHSQEFLRPEHGESLLQHHDAIENFARLVQLTENTVWIISKASPTTQRYTREWLDGVNFYQRTGFLSSNLSFCSKRAEKHAICQSLHISHFIDDNESTLASLKGLVPNLFLFGQQASVNGITSVSNWTHFLSLLNQKNLKPNTLEISYKP